MSRPVYKIIDGKGRVLIPRELRAAIREMPEEKQIAIAARLLELLQQRKENRHG